MLLPNFSAKIVTGEVFSGNSGFPSPQKPKFDLIVLIVNFSCSVSNSEDINDVTYCY